MKSIALASLALLAAAGAALAQATTPEAFVQTATVSNLFEIQSSQLALEKAQAPEIKAFAQTMINDHTKAGEELKQVASQAGIPAGPGELDATHKARLSALSNKSGAEFDRTYVIEQQKAHDDAVALFSAYAADGTQPELKGFAEKTLPALQQHEAMADKLPPTR
jgi:putative membrane protein